MRLAIPPFALAADHDIRFTSPWHDLRSDLGELLGDSIGDWDYMTVLRLKAALEIDVSALRSSTHQGRSSSFAVVVSARSSATRLRGPVWNGPVSPVKRERVWMEAELAGNELGGRLDLVTQVLLTGPDPLDRLGASAPGSILWRSRHSVVLEGSAAQFPTESADLSAAPYRLQNAAWVLESAEDDLDTAAAAAMRLVVNESHPLMSALLGGAETADAALALHTMRWDVTRQLIGKALDLPEFLERGTAFEEDTLGWLLSNLIAVHFPCETAKSVRAMREIEPSRYEATLQDASRILG